MSSSQYLPLLGMGTWGMGGKYERDESNIKESVDALRYGFDLGIRMIDVAEIYGEGLSEEIVGMAMKGLHREDFTIVSKVWKTHLRHDDVLHACAQSLERLETDYIDYYLIHWPSTEIPLKETMTALEKLFLDGKIRAIGVSNFTPELLDEAQSYLSHTTIALNQIEYNLLHHEADEVLIPYCKKNNIHIMGYRPFAKGVLVGSYGELVNTFAAKYEKTPNQIALNWLIAQGVSAIPKSSTHEHLKENAGALGWTLSQKDIEDLRNATLLEK